MSRLKKESYIEYLEEVVMSLLEERNSDDDLVSAEYTKHPSFKDCTFSIYNIKNQIKKQRGSKTEMVKEINKEKLEQFRCGGCGNDTYKLYKKEDDEKMILVECTECKSISEVGFTEPKLKIEWGHPSNGRICIF